MWLLGNTKIWKSESWHCNTDKSVWYLHGENAHPGWNFAPGMASYGPLLKLLGWKVIAVTLPGSSEGALFTPKAKHPRAECWTCLATPTRLPRILAGRQRAQDQDSPCTNTDGVVGHLGGSYKGFHHKETHFKGMCLFLYLQRTSHSVLCSSAEPWIDRQVSSTRFVLFWCCISVHRRCCGKIRLGQCTHSVLLQSKHQLREYRNGWWWCSPGLKSNAAIYIHYIQHYRSCNGSSRDCVYVVEFNFRQTKVEEIVKNNGNNIC